jgi:hypothetical protein
MLTRKHINKIRALKQQGATIQGISEKMDISTWTVQKYLKTELKEPSTVLLMEEIEALKTIIDNLEKRTKALEGLKPYTEQGKEIKTTTKPPCKNTIKTPETEIKESDQFKAIEGKYITARELGEKQGYYAGKTIQKKCKKMGYKLGFYGEQRKHYRIPVEDIEKFRKI